MVQENESLKGTDHVDDAKIAEIEAKLQAIATGDASHLAGDPAPEPPKDEITPVVVTPPVPVIPEVTPQVVEAAKVKPDEGGSAPTLPDNVVRSLIASGWSPDEITQQHAVLGVEFEKIAAKVHDKRAADSREWAAHGRMEANQRAAAAEPTKESESLPPTELPRVDVEALKKQYGDDPRIAGIIDGLVGPVNKSIEAMNTMLPSVAESAARQEASEEAALQNEVNSFFSSPGVATYKALYGVGPTQGVDEEAYQNRLRVMEVADQIRVGASYQGRIVGFTEALSLAHDTVSADYRVQAIREDIKQKVQQRAQSVTTPPSKGSVTGSVSAPAPRTEKTRAEIEAYAEAALREIF